VNGILTYQDYEKSEDKLGFILKAIEEYKTSETFINAKIAQAYYAQKNVEITGRSTFLERFGVKNSKVKYFKIRSGFFREACIYRTAYSLNSEPTMDENVYKKLGGKFWGDIQDAGLYAHIDGVCWCYWDCLKGLSLFRATEFFTLNDEYTNAVILGIRFWRIDPEKTLNAEVYELDGVTKYYCGNRTNFSAAYRRRNTLT
jgi:hypothetical protein